MDTFQKTGERDGVSRYVMASNDMEILLREDHAAPVAAFLVLYRVGSRNEAVGYTGATHLLEHMMFKGTPEMNREKGTQVAALLDRVGADYNATTWYDRTNYFETVPSDRLELAVRLEADRMRNALILDSDRQSEMTVVRNELERGENDPLNVMDIQAHATAFREHPYHHPTIGWRSDVEGIPTERLKTFYDTFYWPNNATVVVVGDFKPDQALALIDRYFGSIPRAPEPIPDVYTAEPDQQGERRYVVHRSGPDGIVLLSFRTPEASHADAPALAVLQALLSAGRSSRLYRTLVDRQIASDASASVELLRDPALFQVYALTLPEVSHQRVERALLGELQRLRTYPVSPIEIEKAKRIIRTRTIFAREGATNYSYELSEAVAAAGWNWFFDFPDAVERVTSDDVQRVARTYFRRSQLTAGWFVPAALDPDDETDLLSSVAETFHEEAAPPLAPTGPLTAPIDPLGLGHSDGPHHGETVAGGTFLDRTLRTTLANGATVLVLENHAYPTVAIRVRLKAGRAYGGDSRLLADVVARMLHRGTKRRDAMRFAEDVESLGAFLSESAGMLVVDVRAHALSEDTVTVLRDIAEMLREPAFEAAELEKVKTEIAAEIRQEQDSTDERAFERLTQIVLPSTHPFYRPGGERDAADLNSISLDDVRAFYARHYNGASLTLGVVGDVSASGVLAAAERLFGDWHGEAPEPIPCPDGLIVPAERVVVALKDKANADVVIGHASPLLRHDPDYLAAVIGNAILGQSTLTSRLGLRVRDTEGLTYGISSQFYGASLVSGLWYSSVTVQPANVDRAIASTVEELDRALRDGLTSAEVDDYKANFTGTFKVGLATNAGVASRLIEAEFFGFGPRYLDDFPSLVAAVTLDDVTTAIRKHIRTDRLVIVVAGELA